MPNQYDFKIPRKRVGLSRKRGRATDDEPVEVKKSKAEVLETVRLPKENETKETVKKFKNGKRFSDQDEALKFVKENRKENLFVRSDVGKNAFLVRACYELAAAGQNVLFIYDEHARFRYDKKKGMKMRQRKEAQKKWAHAFSEQAQEDPVKKSMVCENLEDMKEDFEGVQKAIQGKKIVMGSLDQKSFEELTNQLIKNDIFIPDTVVMSGLEHTKLELFLKIRETWRIRVIGSYNLDVERDRASAAEYVRGSGETLNRLFLEMPHHHTNNYGQSDRSKYRYGTDKESTEKENFKVNGRSSSSRKQKNRLKKAVKRFKDGFDFTDPEEALQFVMENRLENLFVKEDVGTHAFLVRVSFELAAAGKKVLFLYDEHRQRNRMKKTFEHAFDVQANGDPVKKAMVCADLEELSESMKEVRRAIEGKKILTGSMDCPEFSGVAKRLNNRNIFVPDTIIISGLEWMTPELFLKFLEIWKVRIVASYSMNGGFSAADFVRGNEERLNILMQEPSDNSSVEEPSAQMTTD